MERNLGLFKRGSFKGGVHPAENKRWTEAKAVEKLPIPPEVIIPVQQHIGAPSRPVVAVGDKVRAGDPISAASGFVSVPAHASISGTVAAIEERP
ncbi:MAG TPA: electron transport complex subunit RsxC, partial [bacterium]|nr:electron transport complex subunit RsxC [bacterium]